MIQRWASSGAILSELKMRRLSSSGRRFEGSGSVYDMDPIHKSEHILNAMGTSRYGYHGITNVRFKGSSRLDARIWFSNPIDGGRDYGVVTVRVRPNGSADITVVPSDGSAFSRGEFLNWEGFQEWLRDTASVYLARDLHSKDESYGISGRALRTVRRLRNEKYTRHTEPIIVDKALEVPLTKELRKVFKNWASAFIQHYRDQNCERWEISFSKMDGGVPGLMTLYVASNGLVLRTTNSEDLGNVSNVTLKDPELFNWVHEVVDAHSVFLSKFKGWQ